MVDAEAKDANERWEILTANLTVRQHHVVSVSSLLERLAQQLQPIEEKQVEAQALIDSPLSQLTNPQKGTQELHKIEVTTLG